MPSEDALSAAIEQLYSLDPQEFTQRRGALARRARHDGDAAAARAIAGLRRPTTAAWIINRLVRSEPGVAAGLGELAGQLRDAQHSLDGPLLRQLTLKRRDLIDAATRQAFDLGQQVEPPASLRHEVASTLEAALADPDVAAQLHTGTLLRSAQWSGFGESGPTLAAVPEQQAARRPAGTSKPAKRAAPTPSVGKSAAKKGAVSANPTAEHRRRERVSQAEAVLADASVELQSAVAAERDQNERVAVLIEQLSDARRNLDEVRLHTRQARVRHRQAERGLDRAGP
ncbi:MAG: hypothetical protein DLM57_00240 [Pseudonocardiales bacterium]|nr:MAG: hypothetical protein DLM57_00240 [Pseudonocardiales bacterium]